MKNKRPVSDLRIVSGRYKGQKLRSPDSALTHPMGAREKLALFNLLQPYFSVAPDRDSDFVVSQTDLVAPHGLATSQPNPVKSGPKVLDLYAGSGALGIEALSRGAREVAFVEKSPRVARLIAENLSALNPQPPKIVTKIFSESAANFCQRPEYLSYFDIIIADPPYDNFHPEDLASISQILVEDGTVVLSSPAKSDPLALPGLQQETTRTYAAARLTVYRKSL